MVSIVSRPYWMQAWWMECSLTTTKASYLLTLPLCIIFCLTSRIFNCKAAFVGNRSEKRCWNTDVTPSDGKYPCSWKSWSTTPRRWSIGFLWADIVGLLGSCWRESPLSSLRTSVSPLPCSKEATSASASRLGILLALIPTARLASQPKLLSDVGPLSSDGCGPPVVTVPRLLMDPLLWLSRVPGRCWGEYSGSSANCLSKLTFDRTLRKRTMKSCYLNFGLMAVMGMLYCLTLI